MNKFGSSRPVSRSEDDRLLTGQGTFVDSIAPDGSLYACFLRSPVAHARITGLNLSDARKADGVRLVLAAKDLIAEKVTEGLPFEVVEAKDGSQGAAPKRPLLAEEKVRYVGEPVAIVVADTAFQARDACEMIGFDFDTLPAHTEVMRGGAPLHAEAKDNCAFDWSIGDQATCAAAFARASHRVHRKVRNNRVIVNTIEPRGCFAQMSEGRLHVSINGQGVLGTRDSIARTLGLTSEQVRVTTPDVGGGFGMKAMSYPEPFLVAHAARTLMRPVRWMSERVEAMLTDTGARDLDHDVEMAFDDDLRLIGYRVNSTCNLGAYNSDLGQCIQTDYFAMVLSGVYDVQDTFLSVTGIFTNTAPTDAYRGAGRAEASYVLERMMDYAARELGLDPWELRRRNFIQPSQFPYSSSTGETFDPADYGHVLKKAEEIADRRGFAARKAASAAKGRLRGMGLSYYIMNAIGSSVVSTRLVFLEDGTVTLSVPSQSSGQGHESVFANYLSDQTGIAADRIRIIQGDTDHSGHGDGTGGSSSTTVVGNATLATVKKTVEAFRPFIAEHMQVETYHLEFDGHRFRAPDSNLTPTLLEAADLARACSRTDLLTQEGIGKIENWAFPNGAHVAEVEVDPETGKVTLQRYSVVDDFGNLINPLLVQGQVHGGSTQGIGQALMENAVFDEDGQLLSASFMDYALPRTDDLPMFSFANEPTPSTANEMGIKGCGEAGTVGAISATANAVADALWESGVRHLDIPCTPHRVWQFLQAGSPDR